MRKYRIQIRNTEIDNPAKTFIMQGIAQKDIEWQALAKCIKYFRNDKITIRTTDYINYQVWYRNDRIIGYLTISKGD